MMGANFSLENFPVFLKNRNFIFALNVFFFITRANNLLEFTLLFIRILCFFCAKLEYYALEKC